MPGKELKNKPLVEAILELRWELPTGSSAAGIEGDPYYRLLLGRFSERVEKEYPFYEPLPNAQIPDIMATHIVQHRFRSSEGQWPLLQIGPGIMTVNETDKYKWGDFKRRCEQSVGNLFNAHPVKKNFKVQDLTLRYIDAVEVDFSKENLFKFLKEKMKIQFTLPSTLYEGRRVIESPTAFNWQASFPCDDPVGLVTLRFALGQRAGKQALIWETLVQAAQSRMPKIPDEFSGWIDKAHELADDWFFKLIEGELEKRFSND